MELSTEAQNVILNIPQLSILLNFPQDPIFRKSIRDITLPSIQERRERELQALYRMTLNEVLQGKVQRGETKLKAEKIAERVHAFEHEHTYISLILVEAMYMLDEALRAITSTQRGLSSEQLQEIMNFVYSQIANIIKIIGDECVKESRDQEKTMVKMPDPINQGIDTKSMPYITARLTALLKSALETEFKRSIALIIKGGSIPPTDIEATSQKKTQDFLTRIGLRTRKRTPIAPLPAQAIDFTPLLDSSGQLQSWLNLILTNMWRDPSLYLTDILNQGQK